MIVYSIIGPQYSKVSRIVLFCSASCIFQTQEKWKYFGSVFLS